MAVASWILAYREKVTLTVKPALKQLNVIYYKLKQETIILKNYSHF